MTTAEALLLRSVRDVATGCLRWTGSHSPTGYGRVYHDGRTRGVHRVAYEIWVGPIPEGLEVDHVAKRGCEYRDCIERSHLEAVTHAENLKRRRPFKNPNGGPPPPTHCPHGHEYTPENTQWSACADGRRNRHCRACKKVINARRRRSKSAMAAIAEKSST